MDKNKDTTKVTISLDDLKKMSGQKVEKPKKEKPKPIIKTNNGYVGKKLGNGVISKVVNHTISTGEYKLVTMTKGNQYILSQRDLNKQILI